MSKQIVNITEARQRCLPVTIDATAVEVSNKPTDYLGSDYYRIYHLLRGIYARAQDITDSWRIQKDPSYSPVWLFIIRTFAKNQKEFFDRMESFGYTVGNDAKRRILTIVGPNHTTVIPYRRR